MPREAKYFPNSGRGKYPRTKEHRDHQQQMKQKAGSWKGDKVTKRELHKWLDRRKGKTGICAHCSKRKKRTEWSNIDHKYKRNIEDYIELCPECHRAYDRKTPR